MSVATQAQLIRAEIRKSIAGQEGVIEQSLVAIIIEEFGADMLLGDFTEALLSVLEDMAGFETSTDEANTSFINQLWSQYHE